MFWLKKHYLCLVIINSSLKFEYMAMRLRLPANEFFDNLTN